MTSLSDSEEETKAQTRFANALKRFALRYDVAVVLVAHPRKTKLGDKIQQDDISGSSSVVKLAHTAISVERPDLRILKCRDTGMLANIACGYSGDCRRIWDANAGDTYNFDWDKAGIEPVQIRADSLSEYGIVFKQEAPF